VSGAAVDSRDARLQHSHLGTGISGIGSRLIGMARAGMIRFDTSDAILDESIGVLRDKFHWDG
jgi:hypothetical protein